MTFISSFTRFRLLVGLGISLSVAGIAAKDPVVMTVGGIDVPASEFQYLYHKNNSQQLAPQSLEEYVEMFKLYRMKVADAISEGLDTTAAFRDEMRQYRDELAQPYLTDSAVIYKLLDEALANSIREVSPSHILLFKSQDGSRNNLIRMKADSLYQVVKNGGNFEDLAARYSEDHSIADSTGNLGFIRTFMLPYAFEKVAFDLAEGEISEVVESPAGYHIIKGGPSRKWSGKVLASHILKMVPPNATSEQVEKLKSQIDSIYNIVKDNPSLFSEIARKNSDDRGSAKDGGRLPWFGKGEMVKEFEDVAFSMANGEVSAPFRSRFGWHIVLKSDCNDIPDTLGIKKTLLSRISNRQDPRYYTVRDDQTNRLASKHNASLNQPTVETLLHQAASGVDSLFYARFKDPQYAQMAIAVIDGKEVPVSDYIDYIGGGEIKDPTSAVEAVRMSVDAFFNHALVEAEKDWLYVNNSDYHNLLKEYRDGSLLYEVSLQKVWNSASQDKEGLNKFFEDNRTNYVWNSPKVKGYLVQTSNDSVAELVKRRLATLPADSLMIGIRKEFKNNARIDKILVAKGENPMVDHLMFNGPQATPSSERYSTYFLFGEKLISQPEEAADVRVQVSTDYQNYLEEKWKDELKKKYEVKINSKELNKLK